MFETLPSPFCGVVPPMAMSFFDRAGRWT